MKLYHVFIFNAITALGYSVGLLVIPSTLLTLHGMSPDPSTILVARYVGVSFLGIGLVTWLARNSGAQDAITLGLLICSIAGFLLSLQSTLTGQMNALGWLPVVIYLLLIAGYSYFRFR
jgi:hypothetical protein